MDSIVFFYQHKAVNFVYKCRKGTVAILSDIKVIIFFLYAASNFSKPCSPAFVVIFVNYLNNYIFNLRNLYNIMLNCSLLAFCTDFIIFRLCLIKYFQICKYRTSRTE